MYYTKCTIEKNTCFFCVVGIMIITAQLLVTFFSESTIYNNYSRYMKL